MVGIFAISHENVPASVVGQVLVSPAPGLCRGRQVLGPSASGLCSGDFAFGVRDGGRFGSL
jgi:hypothetical protein